MTLLVTGGTGFIGSHFLRAALAQGNNVFALRRPGSRPAISLQREPFWIDGELSDFGPNQISQYIPASEESAIVHFAAQGVNPVHATWESCFQTNVLDSISFWRAGVEAGVSRLIICGTCFEYGSSGENLESIPIDAPLKPTGPYHASKAAASMAAIAFCAEKNIQTAILRPFHVFGEGEGSHRFWPALCHAAKSGKDFPMTAGEQVRDFVRVEQVAQTFLNALTVDLVAGRPFLANIGTGVPQTLKEFADFWWRKWEGTGELLLGRIPYRPNEVMRYVPASDSLLLN